MSKYQFNAEIGKVLNLVIHSIYTNKDIFIRELISNASDACDKFRYFALQHSGQLAGVGGSDDLQIKIELNPTDSTITISDSGIGMNKEELIENLGNIAHSGTQKFIEQIEAGASHQQIGQFGVGFYSAFMVADHVTVYSTKATSGDEPAKTYVWSSDGASGFEVYEHDQTLARGTVIVLKTKPEESEFIDKYRIRHIISTYSDHIAFPIKLIDESGNEEVVNRGTALWIRPKSEISENEYNEFYRHIAHSPEAPWLTLHNNVEGGLEYTSLLYIPKSKPYDLFHPDRKSRVKLYIKRVFITEDAVTILPAYLRFIRGIVDSTDLPLNISRENLQYNGTLLRIKKSLVKRILSELKRKSEQNEAEFISFWRNFGEVIKEGLCENALEEKEQILDILRFHTTKADEVVGFQTYLERMAPGQEQIFYMTGDNLENMRRSPQIEGFVKRGIEVILLKDPVDDFWIHVINQYKNHEIKNVIYGDVDIDKIATENRTDPADNPDNPANPDAAAQNERIVAFCKEVLGHRVKDVRVSKKLVDSPSCLSVPDGAMSGRMEKMLLEQKQLHSRSAKILEINCSHPLVKKLADNLEQSSLATDIAEIIFCQACIAEGEAVGQPHDIIARMNRLIIGEGAN